MLSPCLDDGMYSEHRMVRARSLSKISALPQRSYYLDTSEEEDAYHFPVYQLQSRRRSRASSQENITHSTPPVGICVKEFNSWVRWNDMSSVDTFNEIKLKTAQKCKLIFTGVWYEWSNRDKSSIFKD